MPVQKCRVACLPLPPLPFWVFGRERFLEYWRRPEGCPFCQPKDKSKYPASELGSTMCGFVVVMIRRYCTGGGNLADQISHRHWRFQRAKERHRRDGAVLSLDAACAVLR